MTDKIRTLLQKEYQLHPKAELVDYYKLLYQSVFGAGHFIRDEKKAWLSFQDEWETNPQPEKAQIQEISTLQPMYRIYFGENIPQEDFFAAFILSAQKQIDFAWNDWIKLWQKTEQMLENFNRNLSKDSKIIYSFLKKCEIPSHSEDYKKSYQPHYRIFDERGYGLLTAKYGDLL